jgi:hypothetical protein
MTDDQPCADIGCRHPRSSHEPWGRCSERRAYYNEQIHGYDQPVIHRICDCPEWRPPVSLRSVRDEPQA